MGEFEDEVPGKAGTGGAPEKPGEAGAPGRAEGAAAGTLARRAPGADAASAVSAASADSAAPSRGSSVPGSSAPATDALAAEDVPTPSLHFPVPMPPVAESEPLDASDAAPEPARVFHTRARRVLDASVVVEDAGGFESPLAATVLEVHLLMRERAHLYGRHLQLVADLFGDDSENEGSLEWAEVTAVKIATGLRVSNLSATALVHDAHRAVRDMPATFAVLLAGDMPESFHRYLLRHARRLTPEQARRFAAGEKTWQRILTDPLTGAYLPVNAATYTPTAQMRLQLRLRHPICAVPGCDRPTVLMAEDDHLLE